MTRLSLAAAAALAQEVPDFDMMLDLDDVDLAPGDIERAGRVWAWLCATDSERVRCEVTSDAGLIVALNLPAAEFLRWFQATDWASFDSTERTGGEAWAWTVMDRSHRACAAMGALAVQQAIRLPP